MKIFVLCSLMLAACTAAWAQGAEVTGRVTHPTGALISRATVGMRDARPWRARAASVLSLKFVE